MATIGFANHEPGYERYNFLIVVSCIADVAELKWLWPMLKLSKNTSRKLNCLCS